MIPVWNGLYDGYTLYRHVNKFNNHIYVGICHGNPCMRWGRNGKKYVGCTYFWNAIQKYGWDAFDHEVMMVGLTQQEAMAKEIEFIAYYKSNDRRYGYNLDSGGYCSGRISEESRRKMSEEKKGKYLGERNANYGNRGDKNPLAKPVLQYDLDGNFIAEFGSLKSAAEKTGSRCTLISACCTGRQKTSNGYIWKLKEGTKS